MNKLTQKEIAEQESRRIARERLHDINKIQSYDERMKVIVEAWDSGNTDLFNWCEDYKTFIDRNVHSCVSSMVDYILKKSYDDRDAPFSYDDFNMNYTDYERLQYDILNDEDIRKQFMDWMIQKGITEFDKDTLRDIDEDELKEFLDDENLEGDYEDTHEVYEWWIIGGQLLYRLEKMGEVVYDDIWGRCTTGQSISLDSCCRRAFIDPLIETYGGKDD